MYSSDFIVFMVFTAFYRRKLRLCGDSKSTSATANLQVKRNSLMQRILQWREVQQAYMPSVQPLLESSSSDNRDKTPSPEYLSLYLPSSLSLPIRNLPDISLLGKKESRLRIAQADEALQKICQGRRTVTGLMAFKKLNVSGSGNKANTRMRELASRYHLRIQHAAETYRAAYNSLLALQPNDPALARFQPLNVEDIRGPGKDEDIPSRNYKMSWIWLVGKGKQVQDDGVNESLRTEWCKVKARHDRWNEEFFLVIEEMRRVVSYLEWKAQWWRLGKLSGVEDDQVFKQGIEAYAERQAHLVVKLAKSCIRKWLPLLLKHGVQPGWAENYSTMDDTTDGTGEEEKEGDKEVEYDGDDENVESRISPDDLDEWD